MGRIRFYAAPEAKDTDNDGWERFVFHTDPDVPNGGGPNPSGTSTMTNMVWIVTTTNEYCQRYGMGNCPSNAPAQPVDTKNVIGARPTTNSVVLDVRISGSVDDAIKVDGNEVDWSRGPQSFANRCITNEIADLQNGEFELQLWDWPAAGYAGPNEARFGDTNGVPFRVEWTWAVPMEFRLEHITTNGAPLVVNPSGTEPNREITCMATVLPTNIPDSDIHWDVSGAGMAFAGGTNFGRVVHLTAARTGDWVAIVTVSNSTLRPARLRGTVLEKKDVNVYLHIVRGDDGNNAAMTVEHFDELLAGANQIWKQAAVEFHRAGNAMFLDWDDWLVMSTNDNLVAYGTLQSYSAHTSGVEVYCIDDFVENINGLNWNTEDARAGLTIVSAATAHTLAHELGHACGWQDIYTNSPVPGISTDLYNGTLEKVCARRDWCEEVAQGGYGNLTLHQLIVRLLMHGEDMPDAVDIPTEKVYGIDCNAQTNQIPVGLLDMGTRSPKHW